MTPNNIDRYEVRGEIGRGGMATVLKGYDPRFKRDVAIKLLPREFLHDPQFRTRFEREAQTIAALEHPAIVPVYDFGDAAGQLYLVMRLMDGGSLADRLENGPLSISEAARIFERLAPALDSAHSVGIIHRDLKPANILFDKWDNPYLADFGIAKLIASSSTALTATGGLVGTPAYMSPEQVRGVDELDGRSDIYAMGVILFQMLTGQLPYNANTPIGLAFMHVNEPVPNILASNSMLPHTYQAVIEQAMAKERAARPRTTVELAGTVSSLALGKGDNRTILDSEAKETIVDPLPERVETEQLEKAEPKPPDTTNLPLTFLEDELRQEKIGLTSLGLGEQIGVLSPGKVIVHRLPTWSWAVIGVAIIVALITLKGLTNGNGDSDKENAIAFPMPTSSPLIVLTNTPTLLPIKTGEPSPTPTQTLSPSKTPTSLTLPTKTNPPVITNTIQPTILPTLTPPPDVGITTEVANLSTDQPPLSTGSMVLQATDRETQESVILVISNGTIQNLGDSSKINLPSLLLPCFEGLPQRIGYQYKCTSPSGNISLMVNSRDGGISYTEIIIDGTKLPFEGVTFLGWSPDSNSINFLAAGGVGRNFVSYDLTTQEVQILASISYSFILNTGNFLGWAP